MNPFKDRCFANVAQLFLDKVFNGLYIMISSLFDHLNRLGIFKAEIFFDAEKLLIDLLVF